MSQLIEQYSNEVKYAGGINTALPMTTSGNITQSGATTFSTGTGAISLNGNVTIASGKSIVGGVQPVIRGSGATATLTAAQSGSLVLFDRAAGIVFTLPAPAVGLWYEFAVATTITSNAAKIITDAGTTLIAGALTTAIDNTTDKQWVGNGTTHIAITQNGSTTGGVAGGWLILQCVTSTLWVASGTLVGSGVLVTPFATS